MCALLAICAPLAIYSANFLDEIYKKATEDATICVKSYQKLLEDRMGVGVVASELVVGRGDTRDEIVDYVEASKADMLIMGSRDMNALKRYNCNGPWQFSLVFDVTAHLSEAQETTAFTIVTVPCSLSRSPSTRRDGTDDDDDHNCESAIK